MMFVEVTSFNQGLGEGDTNQVKFEFFNPKYHDERSVEMVVDLEVFNETGNTGWKNDNATITFERLNKGAFNGKCKVDYR